MSNECMSANSVMYLRTINGSKDRGWSQDELQVNSSTDDASPLISFVLELETGDTGFRHSALKVAFKVLNEKYN